VCVFSQEKCVSTVKKNNFYIYKKVYEQHSLKGAKMSREKYYLMSINSNFRRIKIYFNSLFGLQSFYKMLERRGPLDKKGNLLPVFDEEEYKENSFVLLKIDTKACPYYRKMFPPMNEDADPVVLEGKNLIDYLKKLERAA